MSAQPDLKCSGAEKEDQILFFKETPVSEVDQTILLVVFCFSFLSLRKRRGKMWEAKL